MARLTQAQQLQQELELQALVFFESVLSKLPDPRRAPLKPLPEVSLGPRSKHSA